ncbi:MAG: hypothetical protein NTZ68_01835 [Candidatus Dependentiae bacterium]|nr:hypothetical protein [Candidatus Dependentiae bacterium]
MKKNTLVLTLLLELCSHIPASAISVVYNFRIAQITRQPIVQQTTKRPNSSSLLLFNYFQKTRNFDIRENYAGGLFTYNRNIAKHFYIRTDLAMANAHQTVDCTTRVDATEVDDILITIGRNFNLNKKSKVTLSGLLGIPTHSVNTLQRVGFGSGQVGVGLQVDGLYKGKKPFDFLWGARYNYFIPRTAFDTPGNCYKFTIGSIADILIALQTNISLKHGLEGGYSGRWGFGVSACPEIANLDRLNYVRNNVYLVYKYTFSTKRLAHRLLFNVSYGSDAKPRLYGYNAVMVWGSWGVAF